MDISHLLALSLFLRLTPPLSYSVSRQWLDKGGIRCLTTGLHPSTTRTSQLFREQPWPYHNSPDLYNREWLIVTQKQFKQHKWRKNSWFFSCDSQTLGQGASLHWIGPYAEETLLTAKVFLILPLGWVTLPSLVKVTQPG